jgi:hypothetical protein
MSGRGHLSRAQVQQHSTWGQGPCGHPDGNHRGAGRPYRPHDLDSKSGCPVIDVLRDTHPECCVPSDKDIDAYPDVANLLDTMPVYCYEECIAKAAACLSGSAGPCGVKAKMLKHWLLPHGAHSECLWEAMVN